MRQGLNWFYILIGFLLIAMFFVSSKYFRGSGHSSVGITYAREYKLNAEKSGIIKSVKVVPGQQVKTGDLLVQVTSNDLDIEIDRLTNRINVLRSEENEKVKLADSRIAFTKAEQGIEIEKLNSQIVQMESEGKLNRRLSKTLQADSISLDNPAIMKITALKKQRSRYEDAIDIKVKDIKQQLLADQQLLAGQILLLQKELEMVKMEREKLNKYASSEGVVQNVYVKEGEQVDAYTSLLSINPVHPTTVIGYLAGKKEELTVGSPVVIRSYDHKQVSANGRVIGYGSVVQLPEILQKSTAVKAFGREVFIEIASANNGFATGEKVLIR